MEKENTSVLLFLDTETVPSTDDFSFEYSKPQPTMDDVPENGRLVKPDLILDWKEKKLVSMIEEWEKEKQKAKEDAEKSWRSEALESFKGKIIVICYAKGDGEVIKLDSSKGEKEMLIEFYNDIKQYKVVQFVAHNASFDLLFLLHRCFYYKLFDLANIIRMDKGYSAKRDFDTMEMASGGIMWKYKISLHNLCKLLGVPTSKDDINGSEVLDAYLRGEIERIKAYCAKDVDRTRKCFYILK